MLIAMENWTKVNKAAVSLLMAVLSWALYYWDFGASAENVSAFTKALGETSEILFFLMGAMAIVEVVDANGGFDFFRERLVSKSKVELLKEYTGQKGYAIGFEGLNDRITLTHEAFSREGFAAGAVEAALRAEGLTGVHEFKKLLLGK